LAKDRVQHKEGHQHETERQSPQGDYPTKAEGGLVEPARHLAGHLRYCEPTRVTAAPKPLEDNLLAALFSAQ